MPLHLLPVLPPDLPHLTTLQHTAFHPSPLMRTLFPIHPPTPTTHAHTLARLALSLQDPTIHLLKVIDTSLPPPTQTISFAKWQIWPTPRPDPDWQREEHRDWGDGVNVPAADAFLARLQDARRRILEGMPCAMLHLLATQPDHQGRGAGGMLVRWGTQMADRAGVACYLEGSVEGYGLYARNGFEDVEVLEWELGEWGGEGVGRFVCMMRPAGGA